MCTFIKYILLIPTSGNYLLILLILGVPMEVAKPCGARSQFTFETSAPLVQMHRVHSYLQHVQAV